MFSYSININKAQCRHCQCQIDNVSNNSVINSENTFKTDIQKLLIQVVSLSKFRNESRAAAASFTVQVTSLILTDSYTVRAELDAVEVQVEDGFERGNVERL